MEFVAKTSVPSNDLKLSKSSKAAFGQIMESLEDESTTMIGLYGRGGIGKTTLAEQVVKSAQDLRLFTRYAVVVVSQTSDLIEIQDKVAAGLYLQFEDANDVRTKAGQLSSCLEKEKKILIILDDIWNFIDLPLIGIAFTSDQKRCKLLLTTRYRDVCSQMNCNKEIHVDVMCDVEAWDLFKERAGLDDASPVIGMAKEVAKECGGLPIAILPLARALKDNTPSKWKDALMCLKESRLMGIKNMEDKNAYICLKMSYDKLNGNETKLCFLMCSLFPKDHNIEMELLVRCAWGLGMYDESVGSIEEVRIQVQSSISQLKDYCLLLDTDDKNMVKMHDITRHLALWMASNGDSFFTAEYIESSNSLTIRESLEACMAISLIVKGTQELPSGLGWKNLKLSLLRGDDTTRVSNTFFEQMRALKVLTISRCVLPTHLPDISTNLRALYLEFSQVSDISSLGHLNKLEILSFCGSDIRELQDEIGEMKNLKLLDLSGCEQLERIPAGLIQKLSRLEELYVTGSRFNPWEATVKTDSRGKAKLSELNSLLQLTVLVLHHKAESILPDKFVLPRLTRYEIFETTTAWLPDQKFVRHLPTSKTLEIEVFNDTSFNTFKSFFPTVDHLSLSREVDPGVSDNWFSRLPDWTKILHPYTTTMIENLFASASAEHSSLRTNDKILYTIPDKILSIVPEFEPRVFNNLISLTLSNWEKLICLMDTTGQKVTTTMFQNLKELTLLRMESLKEVCLGKIPNRFLHKLETLCIKHCTKLCTIFQLEELAYKHKTGDPMLLSSLRELNLYELPELTCLWEGPTQHISLNSLTTLELSRCGKLTYIFPLSMVRTLVHLTSFNIRNCDELECIFKEEENGEESFASEANLFFTRLEDVTIYRCRKLKYVFPISVAPSSLQKLRSLILRFNLELEQIFKYGKGNQMDIELPRLEHICIQVSPKLISFTGGYCSVYSFPSLRSLLIRTCAIQSPSLLEAKKLRTVSLDGVPKEWWQNVLSQLIRDFPNLNDLSIYSFEGVEEVLRLEFNDTRSHLVLPIECLSLDRLPQLTRIYKLPSYTSLLGNLTKLSVYRCDKLRHIFPPTLSQNLPMLKNLIVGYCDELVQIIGDDEQGNQNHLKLKLERIEISGCNKMRFAFPVSAVRGLPNLSELKVQYAYGLEYVFGNDILEAEKKDTYEVVVFHALRKLSLREVPRFTGLSVAGYNYEFPVMTELVVEGCPNMPKESFTPSPPGGYIHFS